MKGSHVDELPDILSTMWIDTILPFVGFFGSCSISFHDDEVSSQFTIVNMNIFFC